MAAAHGTSTSEVCSWCGSAVEPDDGFRAVEHPGERHAVFCRLEHVVPWAMRGAHWEVRGTGYEVRGTNCSYCDAPLTDVYVELVRHRGEHRVADAFCSVDHMAEWAKAGGRFG